MLTLHSCTKDTDSTTEAELDADRLPEGLVWMDLHNGDPAEIAFVERTTGLHVPSLEELSEIESSSRLYTENGALYLSTPVVYRATAGDPVSTPVGFVLSREHLVTVRFKPIPVFAAMKDRAGKPETVHASAAGAFIAIVEALVDRMADALERVGADLDLVSHRIFRDDAAHRGKRRPAREDADLRAVLRRIGRAGDLTSKIRDSLLGIGRIAPYVGNLAADWLPPDVKPHIETVHQDIASLSDYDMHLANKVQLLLDATLGLINIEQNNIIKVLTVVSVVGVPPTLVASMYGMNFRHMPELDWAWGYPYGLALILVSAIGPLLWFKLRGWL
jgi:magnesium transporter